MTAPDLAVLRALGASLSYDYVNRSAILVLPEQAAVDLVEVRRILLAVCDGVDHDCRRASIVQAGEVIADAERTPLPQPWHALLDDDAVRH